jgi:hypothetical protein
MNEIGVGTSECGYQEHVFLLLLLHVEEEALIQSKHSGRGGLTRWRRFICINGTMEVGP